MINYFFFIGTGLFIFVVFRILRYASYRIQLIKKFYPFLVAIELVLWMSFLFWLIHYFFQSKAYYNNLILVLAITSVALLVWFYVKDVVAGFLFRIKHNPSIGQLINSVEAKGMIKTLAPSQIYVEEEGRNIVRVPYSKLLGSSLSLDSEDTHSASEAIIHIDSIDRADYTEVERKINVMLLQSPWCVPGKPIRVEFLSGPRQGVEVSLHLVDKGYVEIAKSKLKNLLESMSGDVE